MSGTAHSKISFKKSARYALLDNIYIRTSIYTSISVLCGITCSFLTTEITDTSTNPAKINLSLVAASIWFYVLIALVVIIILTNVFQQRAYSDVMRYSDQEFRQAQIAEAAMKKFIELMPKLIDEGKIRSISDALNLVKDDPNGSQPREI